MKYATTHIKEIHDQLSVAFYPNPVEDAGLLQIYTDIYTKTSIELFDEQGQKIETVYTGELSNGSTSFTIDTKPLTQGLYLIMVNSEEGNKTIKFTKL